MIVRKVDWSDSLLSEQEEMTSSDSANILDTLILKPEVSQTK